MLGPEGVSWGIEEARQGSIYHHAIANLSYFFAYELDHVVGLDFVWLKVGTGCMRYYN
jgi:hypothetical protein